MSKNRKSTVKSKLGAKSQSNISPDEAMIYALASNIMATAFADVPDAKERVVRARQKLMNDQPNVTLSMRRHLDDVESFVLDSIEHSNCSVKKYH